MKLFTKYNRINLLATIVIFLLASVTFYIAIRYILIDQVDQDLSIEQHEIETYAKEHNLLPEPIPVKDQKISYATATEVLRKRKFKTVGIADQDNEKNPYRTLQFGIVANGKIYTVSVSKSLAGTDDLITSILLISSITILAMLIASVVINRLLLKRLWKPFYETLHAMKKFKLDKRQAMEFTSNGVEEFTFMNETLRQATEQAQRDYVVLKEFTENASHEMQTPLAIIRSKLDLLIQENLSEKQSRNVQPVYEAIEKLSRLTQSLLFLAKIENNQFSETASIDLKEKIEQKIQAFNELWQNQNISVSTTLHPLHVNMNNELADTLLNNLFSNATRHNFLNGFIRVNLTGKQLTIVNSSMQKKLNGQRIFSRFYKQAEGSANNGLGLSIVKQICDVSGLAIHYSFSEQQHSFTVDWP
jgi:signal transduction histidine kinase